MAVRLWNRLLLIMTAVQDVGVMSSFAIVCTVQVIAVSTGFPLLSRLLVPQ